MKLTLRQCLALAGLTTLEVARQPICILLVTACVMLMLLASMQAYQFGEDGKFVRDSALAIHFVFGLLLAAYAACTALTSEIRRGTAAVILSKPVSRDIFFLSKFIGIAALIVWFSACAIPATLLAEKAAPKLFRMDMSAVGCMVFALAGSYALAGIINFKTGRPFASTALSLMTLFLILGAIVLWAKSGTFSKWDVGGQIIQARTGIQLRLIPAGILITMALIVISSFALALATRFSTIPVTIMCAGILFTGLMSDYLFGRHAADSVLSAMAHRLIPNWQNFWLTDALTAGGSIPVSYVLSAGLYAAVYTTAILCVGIMLFRNREIT